MLWAADARTVVAKIADSDEMIGVFFFIAFRSNSDVSLPLLPFIW